MAYRFILLVSLLISQFYIAQAQNSSCPPNLDFEKGDFSNWEFYTFYRDVKGAKKDQQVSGPIPGRTTILTNSSQKDSIGNFILSTPNKSKYFLKLGNAKDGAEGELAAYTFTVPTGSNDYSIVYHYASVFSHPGSENSTTSAGFLVKVFDIQNGSYIPCQLKDEFADPNLSGAVRVGLESYYKPWESASINLSGFAGKNVRIEFSTMDCYFQTKPFGHFQYVYLDINEGCSSAVKGNYYCNPASMTLVAAPGLKDYKWFNSANAQIGNSEIITINPAPLPGESFIVTAISNNDPLCLNTFTTTIQAGKPISSFNVKTLINICDNEKADLTLDTITSGSDSDLFYSYFKDALTTEIITDPQNLSAGEYFIKASNSTGCYEIRSIKIVLHASQFRVTNPEITYFPYTVDITHPSITNGSSAGFLYSYWHDNTANKSPVFNPEKITQSGLYYIRAKNPGCSIVKQISVVVRNEIPNTFTPNGDGKNDQFKVFHFNGIKTNHFKIFNRYGKLVFHNINHGDYWDGTFEGKKLATGYYYWVWDAVDLITENKINDSGAITLVR